MIQYLQCRVLIVGGGPAGATAARELAKYGIDHILLEKDMTFRKPCGGGLMLRAFEEFGISPTLIEKLVSSIHVVSPKGRRVRVDISDAPLAIVDRARFDAALRSEAKGAGSRLIEAKAYRVERGEKVRVWARSTEERMLIEAEYLIAADGVNSLIRKKLCHTLPSRVLTHYADMRTLHTESCQFWFGRRIAPGHYAWLFPHHQGSNVGTIIDPKGSSQHPIIHFLSRLDTEEQPRIKGYHIPQWREDILYQGRVFFVGDSASIVLPFTYEGIYYAMQSARMAVEAIVAGDPLQYTLKWRSINQKRFRFLRLLQHIFLYSDFMAERLVALYAYPRFQRAVIGYWMGKREPVGSVRTLWKVAKVLLLSSLYKR